MDARGMKGHAQRRPKAVSWRSYNGQGQTAVHEIARHVAQPLEVEISKFYNGPEAFAAHGMKRHVVWLPETVILKLYSGRMQTAAHGMKGHVALPLKMDTSK